MAACSGRDDITSSVRCGIPYLLLFVMIVIVVVVGEKFKPLRCGFCSF